MKIKKRISTMIGCTRYSFESEPEHLSNDVIEACRIYKAGIFIIEVFEKDPLIKSLSENAKRIDQHGNLVYYLCDDAEFLRAYKFETARHIRIYSLFLNDQQQITPRYLNDNFAFTICFENYMNVCELIIRRRYYPDGI